MPNSSKEELRKAIRRLVNDTRVKYAYPGAVQVWEDGYNAAVAKLDNNVREYLEGK